MQQHQTIQPTNQHLFKHPRAHVRVSGSLRVSHWKGKQHDTILNHLPQRFVAINASPIMFGAQIGKAEFGHCVQLESPNNGKRNDTGQTS